MKTKQLILLITMSLSIFFPNFSFAQFVDTKWKVISHVGETWFSKPEEIIGKYQEFYKGWAEGVFYSCDYAGQSMTYNKYTPKEFLNNKEFSLFEETKIMLSEDDIFVHRITCNGKKGFDRKIIYPFVTQDNSNKAYYLFEGAIFILKRWNGDIGLGPLRKPFFIDTYKSPTYKW